MDNNEIKYYINTIKLFLSVSIKTKNEDILNFDFYIN